MKKIVIKFLLPVLLSLGFVTSCKFEEETNILSAPSVDNTSTTSGGISIARERLNPTTESVLVYRINVTDAPTTEVHIGTLFPKNLSETLLIFNDQMVYSSKTYKYRYVYVEADSSRYTTEWTTELKVTDGWSTEDSLVYTIPEDTYLEFDPEDYTLKLVNAGNISYNTQGKSWLTNYKPALILKTTYKQLSFALLDRVYKGADPLELKAILPTDYYDTKIHCVGLVGRYPELNKNEKIERIYWTEPSVIKIMRSEMDITSDGFIVESVTSDGGIIY
jgi:hypothetical protein